MSSLMLPISIVHLELVFVWREPQHLSTVLLLNTDVELGVSLSLAILLTTVLDSAAFRIPELLFMLKLLGLQLSTTVFALLLLLIANILVSHGLLEITIVAVSFNVAIAWKPMVRHLALFFL